MQIFVRNLSGKTITLDVESFDTIKSLKEKIEFKEKLPSTEVGLIHSGFQLENEKNLIIFQH